MAHAMRQSGGNRALAAQLLRKDRSTVTKWGHRHPDEMAAIEQAVKDEWLDLCEGQLFKKVRDGDGQSIRYYLDNHGAPRGYGKKVLLQGDPDKPIHTKNVKPDLAELVRNGTLSRDDLKAMRALKAKLEAAGNEPTGT